MAQRRADRRRQARRHPARDGRRRPGRLRLADRGHRASMSAGRPWATCPIPRPAWPRQGSQRHAAARCWRPGCRRCGRGSTIWERDGFAALREDWLARAAGRGSPAALRLGDRAVHGKLVDVDVAGALLLEQADGTRGDLLGRRDRARLSGAPTGWPNRPSGARRAQPVGTAITPTDWEACCSPSTSATPTPCSRSTASDELVGQWRLSTNRERTAEEYAAALIQLMRLKGFSHEQVGRGGDLQRGAAGGDRRCAG